jgi:DNA-binding NtrC family response regulator
VTVRLPPLRERVDEIRPLAERFLKEARKQSGSEVRTIDAQALDALESYAWPGNVRELRNVIERAVVLAEGSTIRLEDLTDRVRGSRASVPRMPGLPLDPVRSTGQIPAPLTGSSTGPIATTGDDSPGDYKEHVRRYEAELILRALHKANGNQTEAAKALNLPLRTLVHKIQSYGIKKKFDR